MRKTTILLSLCLLPLALLAQQNKGTSSTINSFFNSQATDDQRLEAVSSLQVFTQQEDIDRAVALIASKVESSQVRIAALQRIVPALATNASMTQFMQQAIPNPTEPTDLRIALLEALQTVFFGTPAQQNLKNQYDKALHSAMSDQELKIRQLSLRILSGLGDPAAIDRIREGLQNNSLALIPTTEAIRLLAHQPDPKSQEVVYSLLRQSQETAVQLEAIRMLKRYGPAETLFVQLLQNQEKALEVRRMAAASLHHKDNAAFAQQVKPIIFNEKENQNLRLFCLNALSHHPSTSISQDAAYLSSLQSLAEDHQKPQLKKKARDILQNLDK
ncbi:MAG: HEAT repeat domain-containing protein [Bacteroidota bacterium]